MLAALSAIDWPTALSRTIPYIPLITATNALAISIEWICHLEPLSTLSNPISPATISEVFRRAYINGAWTFLGNLLPAIASSIYMWHTLKYSAGSELRRTMYGWAAFMNFLHLFPFGAIIIRHVHRACDGQGKIKDENEVKQALRSWLTVNRVRIVTDILAAGFAVLAVVVD